MSVLLAWNVCILYSCLVLMEVRRGQQIPWNGNYCCLWSITRVLGTEFRSPTIVLNAVNCWSIFPYSALVVFHLFVLLCCFVLYFYWFPYVDMQNSQRSDYFWLPTAGFKCVYPQDTFWMTRIEFFFPCKESVCSIISWVLIGIKHFCNYLTLLFEHGSNDM